jgi:nucleoside-diphosphate-sugar epimerase
VPNAAVERKTTKYMGSRERVQAKVSSQYSGLTHSRARPRVSITHPAHSMSTILVFGASGQVGRWLLPRLSGQHRVIAVSRSAQHDNGEVCWIHGDLRDEGMIWPQTETVISLGPLDAFAAWLECQPVSALRRVIALSSMSAESKRDSIDPQERALAERLRRAETTVIRVAGARAISWTLFRPTLIYGAGSDRSLAPIARFARRWRVLPIPLGASGLRQPVHTADLAAACAAALANPATFGKTYALGGGERLRFDTMLLRLCRAVPGWVLPLPLPHIALRLAARCWRASPVDAGVLARLREPLIADNADAARDFGYAPAVFCPRDVLPP